MIHTTIRVYTNESIVINGVSDENLEKHINYNKTFRFGVALIVDGKIESLGHWKKEDLEVFIEKSKLKEKVMKKDTAPYN